MIIDFHAHVTVDLPAQLARAREAGVGRTVLQSTRIHPEAPTTLDGLRAEFARLVAVIGGEISPEEEFRAAVDELCAALDTHPDETVGLAGVRLNMTADRTRAWLDHMLARPGIVGIGELTPAPGQARLIEPALAVSADHGGVPVLVHGFAPNTADDLRTYASLAARHRSVPVVVGAFGGLNWLELVDLARETPNLHIELSSALQVFAVRAAVRELPERCLFGSNTPYGDVVAARHTVEAAVADPAVRDLVLGGNAARLLAGG
ncbi:amidohydrolase family protein [Kitasatospora sp. GAS204B]|uniref:amidohydrolase family protein n=1 Tax=unclassified Kitasatospora TaxID=2633591 RepID=UPI0024755E10|nr:amidohydrolase family protein [Kitasatospora sp. GAS204B]MDH6118106.1 putative TIM-barrel fold metal-dependent hydrolase [Kitasatospora sp. GAS204B]